MIILRGDRLARQDTEMYGSPSPVNDRVLHETVQVSTCGMRGSLEKGVTYIVMGSSPAAINGGRVMARVRRDSGDWEDEMSGGQTASMKYSTHTLEERRSLPDQRRPLMAKEIS